MTRLGHFRDRPVKNLSGGMKQKLGLVCTLIHEPELIILDDPPPASILSRGAIAFAFGMWRFRRQFS